MQFRILKISLLPPRSGDQEDVFVNKTHNSLIFTRNFFTRERHYNTAKLGLLGYILILGLRLFKFISRHLIFLYKMLKERIFHFPTPTPQ